MLFIVGKMMTYKFRLYPNKEQEEKLNETLNICRGAYNFLLGQLNSTPEGYTKYELQSELPNLKICDDRYRKVYSKSYSSPKRIGIIKARKSSASFASVDRIIAAVNGS